MIRPRVISLLTLNDGVLFRTKEFEPDYRYTANFVDTWSIDELIVLDVSRPGNGERKNFLATLAEIANKAFVPLCAGGGIQSLADIEILLRGGADKISLNTAAVEQPELITAAAKSYGSQCVVVSIDARRGRDGQYEVFTHFGTRKTGLSPDVWAKRAVELGAGEVLICSIERDGSLEGYDTTLAQQVAGAINVPLILAGGAGNWNHFHEGLTEGGASAVATTCIYHFTEASIRSAKTFLLKKNIPVREG